MTAPMPETMSPREKVAEIVRNAFLPYLPEPFEGAKWQDVIDATSERILAALASSGDHAELARLAEARMAYKPAPDTATSRAEEAALASSDSARFRKLDGDFRAAFTPAVCSTLLAEIAALRETADVSRADRKMLSDMAVQNAARATEAERKLAEADKALELAAIRFDEIYEAAEVDNVAYRNEATIHAINGLADVAQAEIRAFLSKEAERG